MKIPRLQKTYPGEFPRPNVETSVHEIENLVVAGTSWGNHDALKYLNDTVKDFLAASIGDHEATSPFARLPSLSAAENNLRSAVLVANDSIWQKCNKEVYTSSCEAMIIHTHNSEMAWIQIGQPHLLLVRGGRLFPLEVAMDLSIDYKNSTPLPSRLIGLERAWDLEVKSMALGEDDALILLARSLIPPTFFTQSYDPKQPEKIVDDLFELAVQDDQKTPFWLSLFA